jgi:hypothetical protein
MPTKAEVLAKQFADRRWRLSNLYFIVGKDGQRQRLRLNWMQEELLRGMHYSNLVLKARQMGSTTFWAIYLLDLCCFNSNVKAGVVAHTADAASAIFREKIKYPFDNLPEVLREKITTTRDSASELVLSNNSSIRVGTSLRGGTFQALLISEYGKLCAAYPEKAREVRTGSLNTVAPGQLVIIESTAEGTQGHFHELCATAQTAERMGRQLTPLDWKYWFFPWFRCPEYVLPPDGVVITNEFRDYFAKLAGQGINLTSEQMAWYVRKAASQGLGDMKREFPSTAEEAFEASVEGAYYSDQMAKAEAERRIGSFPAIENVPVHCVMDIGVSDATAIWWFQVLDEEIRCVGYFEASGEGMPYFVKEMHNRARRLGWKIGDVLLPHDAVVKEWGSGKTRLEQLVELIDGVQKVPRSAVADGINAARSVLARCVFDEAECAEGIACLKNYRKDWDAEHGIFKDRPRHDDASHGADSFRYLAMSVHTIDIGPTGSIEPTEPGFPKKWDLSQPSISQIPLDWMWEAEKEFQFQRRRPERF